MQSLYLCLLNSISGAIRDIKLIPKLQAILTVKDLDFGVGRHKIEVSEEDTHEPPYVMEVGHDAFLSTRGKSRTALPEQ